MVYDKDYISAQSVAMDDEVSAIRDQTGGPRAKPKTPSPRPQSQRRTSNSIPEEAKLAASPAPKAIDDRLQDNVGKHKALKGINDTPDQFSDIRNMSHEYAVKVDSDYEYTLKNGLRTINQDSEFAEGKRIGPNEDITEIDGEGHPRFKELTQEQQMELIARQEY